MKGWGWSALSVALTFVFASCVRALPGSPGQLPLVVADQLAYDGKSVSLRLLLSGHDGTASVVDGRLVENVHFSIAGVRSCEGKNLRYQVEDYFPPPAEIDDLVTLQSGYHYGTNLTFTVFKSMGPDCIVGDFLFWPGLGPTPTGKPISLTFEKTPSDAGL